MKPKVGNAAKHDDDDTILLHRPESLEGILVLLVLYGCLVYGRDCVNKYKLYFAQSHNPRWMQLTGLPTGSLTWKR